MFDSPVDILAERGAVRLVWNKEAGQYVEPSTLGEGWDKPRNQQRADFLKGPIPMGWLERACQLPGKAAHVAFALWYVRGFKQSEPFRLKRATLARFGVHHREIYYRALAELEEAGLIQVTRQSGRALSVTVMGTSAEEGRS